MPRFPLLRHPLLMAGSLALNVLLGCAAFALWVQAGKTPQTAAIPAVAPAAAKPRPLVVKTAPPKPFHWSQLETPDFASYVKNLRGVGCPEATIRDIVAGELNEIHAEKRKAMATTSGPLRAAEEMKLQAEYEQLLTKLTAPAASSEQASQGSAAAVNQQGGSSNTAPSETALTNSTPAGNPAADIPAAFTYGTQGSTVQQQASQGLLNAGTPDPTLSPAATAALQQMQSDFAQAVGETNAPSDSPAYRARWNQVRRDSDEQFSSMFGGDLFILTQIEAVNKAATAKAGP
ncbi:MAG: hypothetical protein K9N47_27070 [Prosthecobacter sp.]|uniref:hypothetical protein n=1 Tax=Prosthecobacter sp. TaxID=1965333 RepID=UPI002618ECC7|nr:hypothetical protein [Prosthecobacter sp.]MCF7789814.1 hypothetical protein [Prosthecobacter sp.]